MATTKFTGKAQTLVFNSESSGTNYCVTSIDASLAIATLVAECAGSGTTETVTGQISPQLTVNGYIKTQAMDDLFDDAAGSFAPGTNATDLVWNAEGAGTGNPTFTSTSATIGTVDISNPVNGICTFSFPLMCDDYAITALA